MLSCSLWFTSELNAKDHIEGIHHFREGHGTSFYECLREYGMEWFGSRTFFEGRRQATQAIWMDLALARRSGQELRNSYMITKSPEHAPLRRFFKAAVDQLQMQFDTSVVTSVQSQSMIAQIASGGHRLRRCFFRRQPDAAISTSRHPRSGTTGGISHGDRNAGR